MNHYKEAVEIIQTHESELETIKEELGLMDNDLESFLDLEKQYFKKLQWPSREVSLQIRYVQSLTNFANAQYALV